MFGYVTANWKELDKQQQERYTSVYCGICRELSIRADHLARMTLQYDMAFLALLHMSLYEPEETSGTKYCLAHPLKPRNWADSPLIRYAADMNIALAYFKALDDWQDDGSKTAKFLADALAQHYPAIAQCYPRQTKTIERCLTQLRNLELENCQNPDTPAAVFGELMAELFVWQEDIWSEELRRLGFQLGRFLYLMDAMLDYDHDRKKQTYNPFSTTEKDLAKWEQYLILAMSRVTESYEKLPLVQDKPLLDNILYSGIWVQYRAKTKKEDSNG